MPPDTIDPQRAPESSRSPAAFVGIDWGTTHRRVCALDESARPLRDFEDAAGMLASRGRFAAALAEALERIGPLRPHARVLLAGMVGSAQGWHEVPYVDCGVPLPALGAHLFRFPDAPGGVDCRIVPGLRWRGDDGTVDVMRGEETQLLGLVALGHRDTRFVHPGTHAKWGELRDGRVARFTTYMTGELFGLLSQHGTLAALMQQPVDDAAAFADGVRAGTRAALSHALFEVRARVVAGDLPAGSARDHASGVLIGAEWHDALARHGRPGDPVCIFGDERLVRLHVRVAQQLGVPFFTVDANEAQRAGWAALADNLGSESS